jgi:hypothetical protein
MRDKMKYWKKEVDTPNSMVWRNEVDPTLTYEIHTLPLDDFVENYYAFPARNGRGIPNSPELFMEKKDAIEWAKDWMKDWEPDVPDETKGWKRNYWGV